MPFNDHQPGLSFGCVYWLHEHDIAAVCADNVAVEVMRQPDDVPLMAFHMVALRDMGMPLGELFVLEDLAAACRADGIYDFFFAAPPLYVPGGVGSPLNPLAIR
jgi:kynurenine formamidase